MICVLSPIKMDLIFILPCFEKNYNNQKSIKIRLSPQEPALPHSVLLHKSSSVLYQLQKHPIHLPGAPAYFLPHNGHRPLPL